MARIRPATDHETPLLARLHIEAALAGFAHIFPPEAPPPVYDEVLAQWEWWLDPSRRATTRAFVAHRGEGPVGVVLVGPDPDTPDVGHLSRLYVAPACWALGIGRQLHDVAIAFLYEAGFPEATLWVLEGNTRARSWYERLGWAPTPQRKPTYAPANIVDIQYRRVLSS